MSIRKTIGIIGPIASGKDTVADYLKKKYRIPTFQVSDVLKELAKEAGIEVSREKLIQYSRTLRKEHGDDFLVRKILEEHCDTIMAIIGIRQLGQIGCLRRNTSCILVGIDANQKIRFQRMQARGKRGDPTTWEGFLWIEREDNNSCVQRVSDCMNQVQYRIENTGTHEELYQKVDAILWGDTITADR